MELHALDWVSAMPDGHHLAVLRARRHNKLIRHLNRSERVVAAGLDLLWQPSKDSLPVVMHAARLPM
jgi:hypothetical protein